MRLDQFLQKSGIFKSRTQAKEFCDRGAVQLNAKKVKPSHEVDANDTIAVRFRDRLSQYLVLKIPIGNVRRELRGDYVQLTSEEHFHEATRS